MVQEVFLQLLENPDRFEGRSKVSTWLYAIATNLCLNRLRDRAARGAQWRAEVARHLEQPEGAPEPGQRLAARQIVDLLMAEVDPVTAQIAVYHFVDGLSQGEIADLVGLSRITINKRLGAIRREALALEAAS